MRWIAAWLTVGLSAAGLAQTSVAPRLLRRSVQMQEAPADDSSYRPGRSGLPDEAAGTYPMSEQPGEAIEMILNGTGDDCRLEGYLTRLGDGVSDRGALLTFFFTRTTVSPSQLTFTTRQVHGIWWSFAGQIVRGSVALPSQRGYFFLNGTLTEHFDTGQSQARRLSLPLLPEGR